MIREYCSLRNRIAFAAVALLTLAATAFPQASSIDRDMAMGMLNSTKDAIKKNYYDPSFHGVDLDFVFDQAKERMKAAPTRDALMMVIASTVLALDDSHTNFYPPPRAAEIEYGWQVDMVGDECFVTRIKPGSDAEAKGLKVDDKLLAIDGLKPIRKNMWQMYYRYLTVAPTARVTMTLLSLGEEKPHNLDIQTKISKTGSVITLSKFYERGVIKKGWFDSGKPDEFQDFGKDLLIWKMHTFADSEINIDQAVAKARGHKNLILDLRDNGGGYIDILKRLTGSFFDKDLKIADEKARRETKPMTAKTRGSDVFTGNLIVLINHNSASCSEVFARTIQLQKRGKVIGDKSAGAVMESKIYEMDSGIGNTLYFGASITVADIIMPDGASLEKTGVTPDEISLPTGRDLSEKKDPVLSYAAKLCGVDLAAEKAGTFFPFEWPK